MQNNRQLADNLGICSLKQCGFTFSLLIRPCSLADSITRIPDQLTRLLVLKELFCKRKVPTRSCNSPAKQLYVPRSKCENKWKLKLDGCFPITPSRYQSKSFSRIQYLRCANSQWHSYHGQYCMTAFCYGGREFCWALEDFILFSKRAQTTERTLRLFPPDTVLVLTAWPYEFCCPRHINAWVSSLAIC